MKLTKKEIMPIKAAFQRTYFCETGYREYLCDCGVSNLRFRRNIRGEHLELGTGESLEDLCLVVNLNEQPPTKENLPDLPKEYQGIRVFYDVVG